MNINSIDWNAAWKEARKTRTRFDNQAFWNKRAPAFAKHAGETDYARQFIELLQPEPSWSVLDVGCGSGTLAVPLAKMVNSVTALDFSKEMLGLLQERCAESGITNISPLHGSWYDDWDGLGVGTHDVVIASRSMAVHDISDALAKLNRAARKRVVISTITGDGPRDRRILEAAGREHDPGPDYLYHYNMLHQMGIYATVSFIQSSEWKQYPSIDAALDEMLWMLDDLTAFEETRLKKYLAATLTQHEDGWRLPWRKEVRWAVMSWEKTPCL